MTREKIDKHDIFKLNRENGWHFFSPDTMRFFDSRLETGGWPVENGWLFVYSNRFHPSEGDPHPRQYFVRRIKDDGSMSSEKQEFESLQDAIAWIEKMEVSK